MLKILPTIIAYFLLSATLCSGFDIERIDEADTTRLICKCEQHPDWMIEKIVDDLLLLDKFKADHESDSITIAELKVAFNANFEGLNTCEQMLVLERVQRGREEAKFNEEHQAHQETKDKLALQKFLKWVGFGLATLMAILAATR